MSPASTPSPDTSDTPHWNPQVIGLVGLICSIFLLFSYYKMLERNCISFRIIAMSRNREQRRRINEHLEDLSSQFQSRGLDSYIIHSLPITQFKKNVKEEEDFRAECAVCLGEFEEGAWVKHLPRCSHVYHVSCIDTWFQTHSSCPLCRSCIDDGSGGPQCSLSVIILDTLEREDFHRERSEHYQVFRSQVITSNGIDGAEHHN